MSECATDRLIERDGELAHLESLIDGAVDGAGALAVVEGEAGIGKTRLLGETYELARARGLEPLVACGGPLERGFAFGVARQLFEPALHRLDGR